MSSTLDRSSLHDGKDFATLADEEEYGKYFAQLSFAASALVEYYRQLGARKNFEATVIEGLLKRLLHTVDLLRLKYHYQPSTVGRPLWVDLTASGFPNHSEISSLGVDLRQRAERLRELPTSFVLKRAYVDHLFSRLSEPREILAQLCERTYLELLDPLQVFLPFTPGEILLQGQNEERRNYLFSWGCYDFATNRPYVHLLNFEQNRRSQPLEVPGPAQDRFLEVLSSEGSRVPDLALLAIAIDTGLEDIHPKVLKRLCFGPLYSPLLLRNCEPNPDDPREEPIRSLFARHGRSHEKSFMLFFTDELVFSKRQEVTRSLFSREGRLREVFAICETDPEAHARRASLVYNNVLLPHRLLQHIHEEGQRLISGFDRIGKITFDERGIVHGIQSVRDTD